MWWAFLIPIALNYNNPGTGAGVSNTPSVVNTPTTARAPVVTTPSVVSTPSVVTTPSPAPVTTTPSAVNVNNFITQGPGPSVADMQTAIISDKPWTQAVNNPQSLADQGLSTAQILALAGWPS